MIKVPESERLHNENDRLKHLLAEKNAEIDSLLAKAKKIKDKTFVIPIISAFIVGLFWLIFYPSAFVGDIGFASILTALIVSCALHWNVTQHGNLFKSSFEDMSPFHWVSLAFIPYWAWVFFSN